MAYVSQVRPSDLRALEEKVSAGNYGAYLRRMTLKKVRGFSDQVVSFDFPVTAIIGPNGGGKTTILGAAAILYKRVQPGRFFAKSGRYDPSMTDWAIEYEVIDKKVNAKLPLQRTASFKKLKWNRRAVQRPALVFGVSRTVPATERRELIKAIGSKFTAKREEQLSDATIRAVEAILGKPMQGCSRLTVDTNGKVTLFAASTDAGDTYSEFHFGAGEASVIRIVAEIETLDANSIVFIEEIENGLHPVATRRLVEHLVHVAKANSLQVIFTTHSNDALDPLPPKAIWAAFNGEVVQGKLDVTALRTVTGQVDASLAIFLEDAFAVSMMMTALRYHGGLEIDAVEVHGMGGIDPAIGLHLQHNQDPTAKFPSVCVVDGDSRERTDASTGIYALPGTVMPEAHVFDAVYEKIDSLSAKLAVNLHLPSSMQNRVADVVREKAMTNRDRHTIFFEIGDALEFTTEAVVVNAFLALWAQERPEEVREMLEGFNHLLPRRPEDAESTSGDEAEAPIESSAV